MCGIVGIRSKNKQGSVNFNKLESAVQCLKHRGPDAQGFKEYANAALGHARLAVIDVSSSSNQPFQNERYSLVFNGEIYNYESIKETLIADGVSFKTDSDTEVLFQLLIKKGEKALGDLNGCFAFAFYDRLNDYFLLARDRFGIKPLYIYEDENQLLFASEIKALLAFDFDKEVDNEGIGSFFRLTYFPGNRTLFKNVKKILPAHYYESIQGGKSAFKTYFKPFSSQKFEGDYTLAKSAIKRGLNESVARRLIADVPIGTFLSGGVDSTIISALAKRQKSNLRTFSVGFDHPYFDESNFARIAAKKIGSIHEEIRLDKKLFRDNFEEYLGSLDEPFADSSSFAMFLLAKYAKKHVTVCLSGDGADELFGGYRKYVADDFIRSQSQGKRELVKMIGAITSPFSSSRSSFIGDKNRKLQKLRNGLKMDNKQRYYEWCTFIKEQEKQTLLKITTKNGYQDFLSYNEIENFDDLNSMLIADQTTILPNDMLKKVDMMSMASALEVRTPFLDHNFVKLVNSLPVNYKVNKGVGKSILKDTFSNEIPEEIIKRSKAGFEIPIEEWLGDIIMDLFQQKMFSKSYVEDQGIFNWNTIEGLKKKGFKSNDSDHIYLVWSVLVFQHWYTNNVVE